MSSSTQQVPPIAWPRQRVPTLFVLDPRAYRSHRGFFLHADRVFLGPLWTPVVRVRPRLPRASDGGTEI